jgi:hypothetical protein
MQTAPLILNIQSEPESDFKNQVSALVDWRPKKKYEQNLL